MDYYDEIADGYDELHRVEQEEKLKLIKEFLLSQISSTTTLLDIGCGTGISMEPWDCKKIGIDPSAKLLEKAKAKGFSVKQAIAENLPFPDKSFDICLALTSLHHADFKIAIKEIHRVCKSLFVFSNLKKSELAKEGIQDKLTVFFTILETKDSFQDTIYFCRRKDI